MQKTLIITYILISMEIGMAHMPLAVRGQSGKLYGHATSNKAYEGKHVLEIDQKTWEEGAARDIALMGHRAMSKWEVRVKVSYAEGSELTKVAEDLDAAKATIASLEAERDSLISRISELEAAPAPKPVEPPVAEVAPAAPDVQPEATAPAAPEQPTQPSPLPPDTAAEPMSHNETSAPDAPVTPVAPAPDAPKMTYRELRALAKQIGVPNLETLKSVPALEEAIAAHRSANQPK